MGSQVLLSSATKSSAGHKRMRADLNFNARRNSRGSVKTMAVNRGNFVLVNLPIGADLDLVVNSCIWSSVLKF